MSQGCHTRQLPTSEVSEFQKIDCKSGKPTINLQLVDAFMVVSGMVHYRVCNIWCPKTPLSESLPPDWWPGRFESAGGCAEGEEREDFEPFLYNKRYLFWGVNMGVSINGGIPKWMIYSGTSHSSG